MKPQVTFNFQSTILYSYFTETYRHKFNQMRSIRACVILGPNAIDATFAFRYLLRVAP
jgi:hypothetical protein